MILFQMDKRLNKKKENGRYNHHNHSCNCTIMRYKTTHIAVFSTLIINQWTDINMR